MDPEPPESLGSFMSQLDEALALEHKFRPFLELSPVSRDRQDVTVGMRDGSAHVLRCLKIWYDLPSDVFFVATNLMDRFLTKMKVKAKHMACMSVASFQLACRMVCSGSVPELQDILTISQAKCSVADLIRMQGVVSTKLGATPSSPCPVTPVTFLGIYHSLLSAVDSEQVYTRIVNEYELMQLLEVTLCEAACANFRPSETALALLCCAFDTGVARLSPPPPATAVLSLVSFIGQIQQRAKISEKSFLSCHAAVLNVLARYNAEMQIQHRQRLVWKVSQRTLRYLRPTGRLVTTLQTIDEHGQLQIPPRSSAPSTSTSANE